MKFMQTMLFGLKCICNYAGTASIYVCVCVSVSICLCVYVCKLCCVWAWVIVNVGFLNLPLNRELNCVYPKKCLNHTLEMHHERVFFSNYHALLCIYIASYNRHNIVLQRIFAAIYSIRLNNKTIYDLLVYCRFRLDALTRSMSFSFLHNFSILLSSTIFRPNSWNMYNVYVFLSPPQSLSFSFFAVFSFSFLC